MGEGLVLELQRLARTSNTNISELLRHAKVVAAKLNLDEARAWIDQELAGYPPSTDVPLYRVVPSELQLCNPAHGWQPVAWGGEGSLQKHFASCPIRLSIAEVEVAAADNSPGFSLSQSEMNALLQVQSIFADLPVMRTVSRASLVGIIEQVRAKILDWSLALERNGVIGDGMTFNDLERKQATLTHLRSDGNSMLVLFLSANPDLGSPLNVELEQSRIVKVRNGSKCQSRIGIEGLPRLDLPEFAKSLRLHRPTIVHFSGHGGIDGSLLMYDENQVGREMSPAGLAKLLAIQKSTIRLVVLNACFSLQLADLLSKDIDFVVGMSSSVSDAAAMLFAQTLYGAIFDGASISDAFAFATATVEATYPDEKDTPAMRVRSCMANADFKLIE